MCRLEILKLRYYWKILHGPADTLCYRILKYRRERLLHCSKGFAHDVFNICIKYNLMHLWHGLAPQGRLNSRLNPLHYIKRVIISHNLRSDLEEGRTRNCSFSKIYLANPFLYQKKYQIVKPFTEANCFSSSKCRKHYINALLHPASYLRLANFVATNTEICATICYQPTLEYLTLGRNFASNLRFIMREACAQNVQD